MVTRCMLSSHFQVILILSACKSSAFVLHSHFRIAHVIIVSHWLVAAVAELLFTLFVITYYYYDIYLYRQR